LFRLLLYLALDLGNCTALTISLPGSSHRRGPDAVVIEPTLWTQLPNWRHTVAVAGKPLLTSGHHCRYPLICPPESSDGAGFYDHYGRYPRIPGPCLDLLGLPVRAILEEVFPSLGSVRAPPALGCETRSFSWKMRHLLNVGTRVKDGDSYEPSVPIG
jgi:hypothetical protein